MGPIMVIAETLDGGLSDSAREMIAHARTLGTALGAEVTALAFGPAARAALSSVGVDEAVLVEGADAAEYNPEAFESAAFDAVQSRSPVLVLLASTTLGMDVGTGLAARLDLPMAAYVTALEPDTDHFNVQSQVYAGRLTADIELPFGAIATVIPGAFPADGAAGSPGRTTEQPAASAPHMVLRRVLPAESGGDVDITRSDVLVSVGRGIQDKDNIELAEEFAQAVGGVVSCTRPVVDAGWLPRARQVGKSGQTVKPKLYLALGISGAPEHLQGMKDAETIIAVNTDPGAPIFEAATYGATVDILDLLPELTELLQAGGSV